MREMRPRLLPILLLAACSGAERGPAEIDDYAAFHVRVVGTGRPMILIPGLGCGADIWEGAVARWSSRYRLHIIHISGFAGRPPIAPPILDRVREELAAYILDRDIRRPVIVGHSIGGLLALDLAATRPDLVGPIVSVDGSPFLAGIFPGVDAAALRDSMAGASPEQFAMQTRMQMRMMVVDPEVADRVGETCGRSDPSAFATAFYEALTRDIRPALPRIEAPVMLVAAGRDAPPDILIAQYEGVRDFEVVVADQARHFIMLDDPELLFASIERFLAAGR